MENFIVSARKYRPVHFSSVVGQSHITNTLKNAIKSNQLAQAFLFCGPRGVGKTTCARILAKTINCQNISENFEACDECESCVSFRKGTSMNIHELDAASNNSVDDIRSLVEQVRYAPQAGKYKIYIIDEVHMLSASAFNAFLKTLEEPPHYAIFILATTEKHKIIPTILSRCQIFDFNRIKVDDIAKHLAYIAEQENISYEMDGLHLIAQKADGALRDALSMFDQIVSFSGGDLSYKAVIDNLNILDYDYYFKVTDTLLQENMAQSLLLFNEILDNGFDGNNFINGLCSHFRNLLVCKDAATVQLLEVSEGIRKRYLEQSKNASTGFLLSSLNIGNQCDINYKQSKNQRLLVELALMKMCHINSAISLSPNVMLDANEAVKKKSNPELKPAKEAPIVENEVANSPTPSPKPAAEPKKRPAVGSTKAFNIPSLKQQTTGPNDETEHIVLNEPASPRGDKPTNAFTENELRKRWKDFADAMQADGRLNMYTMLTANQPVLLGNNRIELKIANKVQQEKFQEEKINILGFLRKALNNYDIDINTIVVEETDNRKRLYTATDKFNYMVEKNPNLMELKNRLDLDIEL